MKKRIVPKIVEVIEDDGMWLDPKTLTYYDKDELEDIPTLPKDLDSLIEKYADFDRLGRYCVIIPVNEFKKLMHPIPTTVPKGLDEAIKSYVTPRLDKEYVAYGEHRQKQLSKFDAYDLEAAIEFGAEWQKEQMLKDAVEGVLVDNIDDTQDICLHRNRFGQKVRILVLKADTEEITTRAQLT